MQDNGFTFREKSACSIKNSPLPEFIPCPECCGQVEIWTDEEEATCEACGHRVLRKH